VLLLKSWDSIARTAKNVTIKTGKMKLNLMSE
jgi:hypothetical protein